MTSTERAAPEPLTIVVTRWRRYGQDRAYVQVDGQDVGYRDLKTGEIQCGRTVDVGLVGRVTAELWRSVKQVAYLPRPGSSPDVVAALVLPEAPAVPLLPDRDLALNPPGTAGRAQSAESSDGEAMRTFGGDHHRVTTRVDERGWRVETDGDVAGRLEQLQPEWRVLHAIPSGDGGGDIDHLVIGPGGVFTINTKYHPDAAVWVRGETFKVNGHNHRYVRSSRAEAQHAARLLSAKALFDVEVRGVIAVTGARGGFTVREQPEDGAVSVVTRKAVAAHLRSLPVVLGPPSIARIHEVARHLATWQPRTVEWSAF